MANNGKSVSGDELLAQTSRWLNGYKRAAWKPVVKDGDSSTMSSKFSGEPWLSAKESWPSCGWCKNPMHLFLQLDLSAMPEELDNQYGKGLFQFFFCTFEKCWVNCYGDHFSPSYLLRSLDPDTSTRRPHQIPRFNENYPIAFPAKRITGWKKLDDLPCLTEFASLGIADKPVNRGGQLWLLVEHGPLGISGEVLYDDFKKLDKCISGDKLGGWPNWVQVHTEYPKCPDCGQPMQIILFSLEGGDNIPFEFADGGRGHVAQCSKHKDRFGFAWQSG